MMYILSFICWLILLFSIYLISMHLLTISCFEKNTSIYERLNFDKRFDYFEKHKFVCIETCISKDDFTFFVRSGNCYNDCLINSGFIDTYNNLGFIKLYLYFDNKNSYNSWCEEYTNCFDYLNLKYLTKAEFYFKTFCKKNLSDIF